jgi:putative drug exporter of the RND superfamily
VLARIAMACFAHRRRVLAIWLLLLLAVIAAGSAFAGHWADQSRLPGTDSQAAYDTLARHMPAQAGEDDTAVFQHVAAHRGAIERWLADAAHTGGVLNVGPLTQAPHDDIATASLVLAQGGKAHPSQVASELSARAGPLRSDGVTVAFEGDSFKKGSVPSTEFIGVIGALVVLLLLLGSVVAAGLPILLALAGIGLAIPGVALLAHALPTPNFATQVAAMIGLGVGIDYTLLVVTRFRRAVADAGGPPTEARLRAAAGEAAANAGRSVVLAGATVVVSLAGLVLMNLDIYYGLAAGCALAVLTAVAATLTLLPALLGFAGRRICRGRVATSSGSRTSRLAALVARRPAGVASAGLIALLMLAAPALSLHLGTADAGTDPPGSTTRVAYDLIRQGFGPGAVGPILVTVDGRGSVATAVAPLRATLAAQPGVASVSAPTVSPDGAAVVLTVTPTTGPADRATADLVRHLRADVATPLEHQTGLAMHVGGETAGNIDFATSTSQRLPWFVGGVLAISFLLLLFGFRSLTIAVQALVVNLLSVGAAYGVIVAAFQWGWLAGPLGASAAPVAPWIPTMLFAITFGLSMDYEVFLIGAIREARASSGVQDAAARDRAAVRTGLSSTARIITAAAAIMALVFGSFVTSSVLDLKVIGLGLAAAIVVDATIIRLLVVPAVLTLLGPAAWWPRSRAATPGVPHPALPAGELVGAAPARGGDV